MPMTANTCWNIGTAARTSGRRPEVSLGCDFHLSYENLQDVAGAASTGTPLKTRHYMLVELSNYSIPAYI